MTEHHEVTITIDENGNLETEVGGISGPNCHYLTAWLETLGKTTVHRSLDTAYRPKPAIKVQIETEG
jgi:hypothetical protein